MENSRTCDGCNVVVHRTSMQKNLGSKYNWKMRNKLK